MGIFSCTIFTTGWTCNTCEDDQNGLTGDKVRFYYLGASQEAVTPADFLGVEASPFSSHAALDSVCLCVPGKFLDGGAYSNDAETAG